jgi:tetratricopeptide (TPR) repeat protein
MPDIGNYTETTALILGEAGKYFALLMFSILAIRLWRRWANLPAADRMKNLPLAGAVTLAAIAIGYFSMCQSLGKLYLHYGMQAFGEGRLLPALSLFETSSACWKSADATGADGVCRLLLGKPDQGIQRIEQAKSMRKSGNVPFEEFYEGLYFFKQGQRTNAVPLLQAATVDDRYRWSVTKLFAIMLLDENRAADAADWMKPFMQADVTEIDQAYIVAALELAGGGEAEARALLGKFPSEAENQSLVGKARFEKLRAQLGD